MKAFIASCTSENAKGKALHLSHIHFPLRYRFTTVTADGNESTSGILSAREAAARADGLPLPLCIGDGGLEEVKITPSKRHVAVNLTFGSGSNEELWFQVVNGSWQLVFVEWLDH
ncbi:hypothetical protein ACQ859_15240 [Roseateles chitinivorans]|uniref:hypothetical protein n=1 Tax=Roseateles chitinivorans TaxID=2917965 RepID=UPI003D67C57B